ncbi:VOC family protein [Undibacterium sp. TJN25]|uniref:VOC family protein n=1 Tax=Undibacterium sp. TJN25 TaxID=3413056 RepID=UPI003BEFD367
MSIDNLDHYSVRTADVARSVFFYENVLGMRSGPRPPFNFPGAWLYRATAAGEIFGGGVVHIIGIKTDGNSGLGDYLGDKAASREPGTGAVDHIAFTASSIGDIYARLAQHRIGFRERKVPDLGLHQVFIEDPDGVVIELNYGAQDDIDAGLRSLAARG